MLRSSLLLFLALGLAACDSTPDVPPPDTAFSLTVSVRDGDARPVADQDLVLVYGLSDPGVAPHAPATTKGGAFLSVPFPNPWKTITIVNIHIPETVAASRLEIFDAEGMLLRTLDLPTQAGLHAVALQDQPDGEPPLDGGVYRLRATLGDDVVEQWTLHTDLFSYERGVWGRRLGRTGSDGTLRVTDRTLAPALFAVPPIELTDASGNRLGTLQTVPAAHVAAWDGESLPDDGLRARVTFTDGPVSVALQP